jgi:hypothetical protein
MAKQGTRNQKMGGADAGSTAGNDNSITAAVATGASSGADEITKTGGVTQKGGNAGFLTYPLANLAMDSSRMAFDTRAMYPDQTALNILKGGKAKKSTKNAKKSTKNAKKPKKTTKKTRRSGK